MNTDTLVSWIHEAVGSVPQSVSNPKYWGVLFAVVVLLVLYSLVSSVRRLNRHARSVLAELAEIRMTLGRMESSQGRGDAKRIAGGKKELLDLPFREGGD